MDKQLALESLKKQLDCIDELYLKGLFSSDFKIWQVSSTMALESLFGSDSPFVRSFKDIKYLPDQKNLRVPEVVKKKTFESGLKQAKETILACFKFLNNHEYTLDSKHDDIQFIKDLCSRFHLIAKKTCTQYRGRKLIAITDEYDVQHLFHALLLLRFDDIRPEDVTSSYAGATSRVDFLLKQEKIVIEVKKTRPSLKDKEIGEQLIIDMKRYSNNPDCETLICFVYDPEQLISNPHGLEKDLSGKHDALEVEVIITPKA